MATAASALWVLIAGVLGLYLVVFAASAAGRLLRSQEEFVYGESWLLDDARRIAAGELLYPPVDRLPLMHTAYTPVYYVIVGELQHVLGDHSDLRCSALPSRPAAASALRPWSWL